MGGQKPHKSYSERLTRSGSLRDTAGWDAGHSKPAHEKSSFAGSWLGTGLTAWESSFRLQNRSALHCPKAERTHPGGPGSQRGGDFHTEIPTVSSEEASPVTLETLAGVVLINPAQLLKQEDRAL